MSTRKTLPAILAVAALGFAALPTVASAYFMDLPEQSPEFTFASEGNTILRAGETQIECTTVEGSGSFADKHSGSLTSTLKGCKSAGTNCTSAVPGAKEKAGEIMSTTLPFDVVEVIHPEGVDHPGLLITPKEGHFMSFKCAFGLVSVAVGGNGLIGTLTSPEVGVTAKTTTICLEEDGEHHQTHQTAHDTTEKVSEGIHYRPETSLNGGAPISSAVMGKGPITFKEGEGTLTGE